VVEGVIGCGSGGVKVALVVPESEPPDVADFKDTARDIDEEEYGEAIEGVLLTEETTVAPGGSQFASSTL
jgi:hypothetical protein